MCEQLTKCAWFQHTLGELMSFECKRNSSCVPVLFVPDQAPTVWLWCMHKFSSASDAARVTYVVMT